MSHKGPDSEVESHSRRVRSTPMNGHRQTGPTGPFRAKNRYPMLVTRDPQAPSRCQFVEQGLGLPQIECVEAFGEPAEDRREKIVGLAALALVAPKPDEAG